MFTQLVVLLALAVFFPQYCSSAASEDASAGQLLSGGALTSPTAAPSLPAGHASVSKHSGTRKLTQTSTAEPVEASTPAELLDAVAGGALDILVTNHMDLTTLDLLCVPSAPIDLLAK